MKRSGRMTDERLREEAPEFMRLVDARRSSEPHRDREPIADPVPRDAPGAAEIGFAIVERYNASSILFDNLAAGRGDKTAVVCGARHLRYAELCDAAARVGNGLRRMGLARGGRVLLLLDDTPEYVAAIFGAIRAGLVPVLVNTLSPPSWSAIFSGFGRRSNDRRRALRSLARARRNRARAGHATWGRSPTAPPASPSGHRANHGTVAHRAMAELECCGHGPRRDGLLDVQLRLDRSGRRAWCTFSTTRATRTKLRPKSARPRRTRRRLFASEDLLRLRLRQLVDVSVSAGATTVLLSGRPDPEAVFATIERDRPTMLFGLPTLYNAMVAHPGSLQRDLSSLRLCLSAAEPLSAELFHEWRRRYGLAIVEGLGSTEVLHIYLSNRAERQTLGASGMRVPGYELRLTDSEGRPVAKGEPGILWVRGDSQAPCYWNRPDKTAETMRGGWIYTGDRFRENETDSISSKAARTIW